MQTKTDQSQALLESPPGTTDSAGQLELTIVQSNGLVRPTFHFHENDIVIREDLTHEEWTTGLQAFKWAQTNLKMGFAKYLKFGEIKFGKQAVENSLHQLEFELPTVNAALSINSVPEEMRHINLSAEHYIVLAKSDVPKKKLIKWAKVAAAQSLTPVQLKNSIEAGEVVTESMAKKNTHGIISIHGLASEYRIWIERVKGLAGIKKMEEQEIDEIIELLKEPAELRAALVEFRSVDNPANQHAGT